MIDVTITCIYKYGVRTISNRPLKGGPYLDSIPDECIAVRVSVLSRAILNHYNKSLYPHGLKITQMFILVLTSRWEGVRPDDLCKTLQIDLSTLSRNVERMRANGWVEWEQRTEGRGKYLKVTPVGAKLIERVVPSWEKAQKGVMEMLSKKGVENIFWLSQKVGAGPKGLLGSRKNLEGQNLDT